MKIFFTGAILLFAVISFGQVNSRFNVSAEQLDGHKNPVGWKFSYSPDQAKAYSVKLDSIVKMEGKYSLSITKEGDGTNYGVATYIIDQTFKGKTIALKGFIKTENVTKGKAGLWLRIDGADGALEFDNMDKTALSGTNDWKEYTIQLPYNDEKATTILLGGLLIGNGKVWIDDLRLYIDGEPIEKAVGKQVKLLKAQADTAFSNHSGIDTVIMSAQQVTNLTLLDQVWGFLKYHHPAVAKGEYNFDAALFRVMPSVIKATNNIQLSAALEKWVDDLRKPEVCNVCKPQATTSVVQKPNYGSIFNAGILSQSLVDKLLYILANHNTGSNFYIGMVTGVGNPIFDHEKKYSNMFYPDAGFRLLGLFRYWNMIQYFYPYKHLIGTDWNNILPQYIPRFANAANKTDYVLSAMALISSVHDTHANIWSAPAALETYRGKYTLPFQAKFIENKLVVTAYFIDTLNVKQKFKIGDVITVIDGVSIEKLMEKYLPYTAASNYETQLRDLPVNYLLRSNKKALPITVLNNGKTRIEVINTIERSKINTAIDDNPDPKAPAFKVMDGNIGYIFPGRFKNSDMPAIKQLFAGTKGIIVDMRCYPSEFMVFTFVPFIKTGNANFVKFTQGSITYPGSFTMSQPLANNGSGEYKGKVVVIVNNLSQSQAEYTTMAFQSSANVTVIGSTTAGADGNVSAISLPGNINTIISGIGILYPDGTETQRKGVKIDYKISPTIKGIKAGRDELLDKAKEIINSADHKE